MLYIKDIINTRIVYYKSGLIIYRKFIKEDNINVFIKMIYMVGIGENIISNEEYSLTEVITLNSLISHYKKMIDSCNKVSKK